MLTSIRGLSAATLSAGLFLSAAPAFANEAATDEAVSENLTNDQEISAELVVAVPADFVLTPSLERVIAPVEDASASKLGEDSGFELSGNVALVSDYRFRGVSFSDGDMALQGGVDLAHSSGIYVGTWASTISGGSEYGELELDVYAGWSGDVAEGVTFDIGLLYYIYPTGDFGNVDTDYFEPYASLGFGLGPASATVGVAYTWEQDSLGGGDNLYLYTDLEYGIPDTPLTLSAHLGYTDGVFATDFDTVTFEQEASFDWGVGASYALTDSLSFGVNYVDTQGPSFEDFTDAGIFFTIGYSM